MELRSGVYIGTKNYGDFGLISTGDYINPLIYTFKLKNTGKTISLGQSLYLIINNIEIEYVKININGRMMAIRPVLSWDNVNWNPEIVKNDTINANNTYVPIPFFLKFNIDDMSEYFITSDVNSLKSFKLELLYG